MNGLARKRIGDCENCGLMEQSERWSTLSAVDPAKHHHQDVIDARSLDHCVKPRLHSVYKDALRVFWKRGSIRPEEIALWLNFF